MIAPRTSRHPLVAEIVGPAGSGKSALVSWLLQHDRSMRSVPLSRFRQDLPAMARGAASCGVAAVDALIHDPRFAARNVRQLLRLETLRARLARTERQGARIALFDEGPVYSIARLQAFCPPALGPRPFGAYLERSTRQWSRELDLVIMLDAPNAVLAERIRGRAKPHRMRDADEAALFGFLDRYRSSYATVATDLAAGGHTSVIRIDTAATAVRGIGEQVLASLCAGAHGTDAALVGAIPAAARHRAFAGH